jgi:hypothetical protein
MLVADGLRNRQVSGSSPLVGSIALILNSSFRESSHCPVAWLTAG